MSSYRWLWIKHNGPIPVDSDGRSYELHHINGNHTDNRLENLRLVTIEEHFDIHASQGDWHACSLIAHRMGMPPDFCSVIQRGRKRPGIGGAPKGRVPWNKGVTGYRLDTCRRGKRHSSKLSVDQVLEIRSLYDSQTLTERYKSARMLDSRITYERFVAKWVQAEQYPQLSVLCVYNIIIRKSWTDV